MGNPYLMLEVISVAKNFCVRPSSLIEDLPGYAAFCFDSACCVYLGYMNDGKMPIGMDLPASTTQEGKQKRTTNIDMSKIL